MKKPKYMPGTMLSLAQRYGDAIVEAVKASGTAGLSTKAAEALTGRGPGATLVVLRAMRDSKRIQSVKTTQYTRAWMTPEFAAEWERVRFGGLGREAARRMERNAACLASRLKRAAEKAEEERRAALDDEEPEEEDIDPPMVRRIVSARACLPVRTSAPRSVFDLGSAHMLPGVR